MVTSIALVISAVAGFILVYLLSDTLGPGKIQECTRTNPKGKPDYSKIRKLEQELGFELTDWPEVELDPILKFSLYRTHGILSPNEARLTRVQLRDIRSEKYPYAPACSTCNHYTIYDTGEFKDAWEHKECDRMTHDANQTKFLQELLPLDRALSEYNKERS